MSEIDINKMVEKAQPRANWETNGIAYKQEGGSYEVVWYQNGDQECGVGRVYELDDAQFIAQSPRAILALHQQVQDLQAANAALQAQVGAWQGKDTVGDSMYEDSGYWVKSIGGLELLAIIPGSAGISHLGTLEWGFAEPPYTVIGWGFVGDESPTAAESEE